MKLKHLHYGWVLASIGACILATQSLVMYTFGIFLVPMTAEFNWERGALSGAYSICLLVAGFLAILSGRLSDKYGPRGPVTLYGLLVGIGFLLMSQINSLWQIYLIWGLFMGIGISCCFIPLTTTIPRWFAQRRGVAVAIVVSGFGVGAIISPPLAQWFISSYGWRYSFVLLGLITFVVVLPLAQFMKHSPQRIGLKPYGESTVLENKRSVSSTIGGVSFAQAITTGRFWILGLALLFFFFCLQAIVVHIAPYAVDIGISPIVAASILSIIAGISVIGRLSMGFVSDRVGGRLALNVCLIQAMLALIWVLFAKEVWMFYVFAVVFGLCYGGIVTLTPFVPAELFGVKSLGAIVGALLLFTTIGAALGPPLAGGIFDMTGGYSLALLVCVIVCALAVIFGLILTKIQSKIAIL